MADYLLNIVDTAPRGQVITIYAVFFGACLACAAGYWLTSLLQERREQQAKDRAILRLRLQRIAGTDYSTQRRGAA